MITIECEIPRETYAVKWNERDRDIYYDLLSKCDKETLLQQKYTQDCMQKKETNIWSTTLIMLLQFRMGNRVVPATL